MFRLKNPTNTLLAGSACVFDIGMDPAAAKEWVNQDLAARGLRVIAAGDRTTLLIPHQQTDAFGGLYLMSSFQLLAPRTGRTGSRRGHFGEYQFAHAWGPTIITPGAQTFTQRFIASFLETFTCFPSIALAVALDDLSDLTKENLWGNSLVVVELNRSTATSLSSLPRKDWSLELKGRAERTVRILERRGTSNGSPEVLISAIGPIDRYPWAPMVDPSALTMYPTPNSERSANIILWARDGIGCITLVSRKEHPLMEKWHQLMQVWNSTNA